MFRFFHFVLIIEYNLYILLLIRYFVQFVKPGTNAPPAFLWDETMTTSETHAEFREFRELFLYCSLHGKGIVARTRTSLTRAHVSL